jgi:hypothetical protein
VAEAVRYVQPRRLNWVALVILLAVGFGAYLVWTYVPVSLRKAEVVRVLDETSSAFTGESSRMLAERKLVDELRRTMIAGIQAAGVDDPEAEIWIEIDDDDHVRFGALYSDWIALPLLEARERLVELQMSCSRPGRGSSWTCEAQDLR